MTRFVLDLYGWVGSAIVNHMQRHPVVSRAVMSVGYEVETGALELEFRSGRVYLYEGVPPSVYGWLLRTKNKGVFVAHHLSGRYGERALPDQGAAAELSLEQALLASLTVLAQREHE